MFKWKYHTSVWLCWSKAFQEAGSKRPQGVPRTGQPRKCCRFFYFVLFFDFFWTGHLHFQMHRTANQSLWSKPSTLWHIRNKGERERSQWLSSPRALFAQIIITRVHHVCRLYRLLLCVVKKKRRKKRNGTWNVFEDIMDMMLENESWSWRGGFHAQKPYPWHHMVRSPYHPPYEMICCIFQQIFYLWRVCI